MSLYTVESTPSLTRALADHRFPIQAKHIGSVARVLCRSSRLMASSATTHTVLVTRWTGFRPLPTTSRRIAVSALSSPDLRNQHVFTSSCI